MPELPEVETLRLGLEKYLVGHKIEDVDVKVAGLFHGDPKSVIKAKIEGVRRFGKGLVIDLSNHHSLAVHVKLTGQLIFRDASTRNKPLSKKVGVSLPGKFTHIIFTLDRGATLYYNDIRRFGWVKVVETNDLNSIPFFKDMGPEPPVAKIQKGRKILDFKKFSEILSCANVPVKIVIMDQKRIGGVGNIYANDSLFMARVDPRRKSKDLSEAEKKKLYDAIEESLRKGLKYGGASELNFVNALGQDGGYQNHMLVYGKKGEPCPNCREKVGQQKGSDTAPFARSEAHKIKRIELGGRGTFFCPKCQR